MNILPIIFNKSVFHRHQYCMTHYVLGSAHQNIVKLILYLNKIANFCASIEFPKSFS